MGKPIPEGFTEVTTSALFSTRNGPIYEKVVDEQTVIRALRVEEIHLNSLKLIHGGMLMTFADSALARAVKHKTGQPCVTIKMNSEFMAPARQGDWIEAYVDIVRNTKSVVFVRGDLKVGTRTIFKADAIFHYIHRRSKN